MNPITSKSLKLIVWLLIIGAVAAGLLTYWHFRASHPTTEDAYLQANVVQIATQITGPISTLLITNNHRVEQDSPLFTIDQRPFTMTFNKAQAFLSIAQHHHKARESALKEATAEQSERQAELTLKSKNAQRILKLVKMGQEAATLGDKVTSDLAVAEGALFAAKSKVSEANQNLSSAASDIALAKATLDAASLNLEYTQITAPATGIIANFDLRIGSIVNAHQPLFALVEERQWWVDANFKETEMAQIKPGQSVDIEVDLYPGLHMNGVVESISRGSGNSFSLFPAENATGNWVKVTQRFTVRIKIIEPYPAEPLRIGASATVTVNTTQKKPQSTDQ